MQAPEISFYDWQQQFSTDAACLEHLATLRWPDGFQCPRCGHDHGWLLPSRPLYECARCHRQTSVTAGTLFHATKLPLTKWFWAIYWIASDKGSISALRLSKLIGVKWRTAFSAAQIAPGNGTSRYPLSSLGSD